MSLAKAQDFAAELRAKNKQPTGTLEELKVDPHFEEDPAAAKMVEFAIKRRKNLLIVGPTGCGKSCLAINVMARLKEKCEIFSCTGETSVDELIAKPWIVEQDSQSITVVVHGAALRAYKDGKGLLLEEVDFAVPDMLAGMHRIMETNSMYYVCNVGAQEVIAKHTGFFVIGTANTIGTGEDAFRYAGTKPLNQAFMNRFSYTIRMDYLDKKRELKVLKNKTGIPEACARQLIEAANDARDAADPTRISGAPGSQRVMATISTRDLLEWSEVIVGLGLTPIEAADYAFLNRINDADRDIIRTFIQNRCS